jgi:hypothetical protein
VQLRPAGRVAPHIAEREPLQCGGIERRAVTECWSGSHAPCLCHSRAGF